jgi:uncharacterized protein YbbK (DUF523 family)/uncharacterized protein YbgA (DUF1722 family)
MQKIKIGVSSCLLGNNVRYDGGHKLDNFIVNTLAQYVEFVPVCPEVECGLGVPREAMRLVGNPENPRLLTIKTRVDHTDRMAGWAEKRLRELEREDLCGFIFKSRSPSSGMERVKVYNEKGYAVKAGIGIFARLFMKHFPYLPVEEEGRLTDPVLRETFIENIFILKEWREAVAAGKIATLMKFHERMKYSFMARSPALLGAMGKLLAGHKKGSFAAVRDAYYELLAKMLKTQSTVRLSLNVLQHLIGYFKEHLPYAEKEEFAGILKHYRAGDIPLILPVTLINHYARKYSSSYLLNQYYLNPHPLELQLRNHV